MLCSKKTCLLLILQCRKTGEKLFVFSSEGNVILKLTAQLVVLKCRHNAKVRMSVITVKPMGHIASMRSRQYPTWHSHSDRSIRSVFHSRYGLEAWVRNRFRNEGHGIYLCLLPVLAQSNRHAECEIWEIVCTRRFFSPIHPEQCREKFLCTRLGLHHTKDSVYKGIPPTSR